MAETVASRGSRSYQNAVYSDSLRRHEVTTMNLTQFKELAEAAQSIAVAIAVLAGGIWALFRFWSLGEVRKSKVEIEHLRKSLLERGTLNISIAAEIMRNSDDTDPLYLRVDVTMTNVGNRSEALDWTNGAAHTSRVTGHVNGTVTLADWIETSLVVGKYGRRISSTLSPGESKTFPFLVPVATPGLYYIAVVVPGSPEETADSEREHTRVAAGKIGLLRWTAETFIQVAGKSDSTDST